MKKGLAETNLPRQRTGRLLEWLECHSLRYLVFAGLGLYTTVIALVSGIELLLNLSGEPSVLNVKGEPVRGFAELLYFNSVTILTVGYGDLRPESFGRMLSVAEAFIGVAMLSLMVAVVTVKAMLPPRNAVVFSDRAFYCTEDQRFLILFVNTGVLRPSHLELCSFFKLKGDWSVKPTVTFPFITDSVQVFFVDKEPEDAVVGTLREGDCLRVGVAAGVGFASFSTHIQYDADSIFVIENRDELVKYFEGVWRPDFKDQQFRSMFYYQPEGAPTLRKYVEARRATQGSQKQAKVTVDS